MTSPQNIISSQSIISNLTSTAMRDIPVFDHNEANAHSGWMIVIQGTCINDSKYLVQKLSIYLQQSKIDFRVATQGRYDMINSTSACLKEQGYQAIVIYVPTRYNPLELCKEIDERISDYAGGFNIPAPTCYEQYNSLAKHIYYRNALDENGNFIRSN